MVTFDDYKEAIKKFDIYPKEAAGLFTILGLIEEIGEIKLKKVYRDDEGEITKDRKSKILAELGDIYWYCAKGSNVINQDNFEIDSITKNYLAMIVEIGIMAQSYLSYSNLRSTGCYNIRKYANSIALQLETLPENVMRDNLNKLTDRKKRDKIKGSGDNR